MKVFTQYITTYFRTDFKWVPHLFIALFLLVCLLINYKYDIYNIYTDSLYKTPYSILFLFAFYGFAFLGAATILSLSDKTNLLKNTNYIIFGLIGILFLAVDSSYYLIQFTNSIYDSNLYIGHWQRSCVSNLSSFVTIIVPLYMLYFSVKHFKPEWFGLRLNGAKVLPYFWLILFMLPLIYIASFQPDFLETYPTYTSYYEYKFLEVPQWLTVGIYELSYGFDFLSVELFFRGFMVIALSRFVGKEALLPMVVVYCFLHFGKPAGEAVSSVFGGYILGILSYTSRNIYGGLIAHLGVAWGMEYMAYIQLNG